MSRNGPNPSTPNAPAGVPEQSHSDPAEFWTERLDALNRAAEREQANTTGVQSNEPEHQPAHLLGVRAGVDGVWGMYPWLDRAPLGRNETGLWWRRHDEYDSQ